MFCINCGKELQAGSRFCQGCGTPIQQTITIQPGPPKLEKKVIIIMVILSLIMLLSMILLPMFTLTSGNSLNPSNYRTHLITTFGDNYLNNRNVTQSINYILHIIFIFTFAVIVATIAFKIIHRSRISLILSFVNLALIITCYMLVRSIWINSPHDKVIYHVVSLSTGNIICLLCSIGMCLLTFIDYKKKRNEKNKL